MTPVPVEEAPELSRQQLSLLSIRDVLRFLWVGSFWMHVRTALGGGFILFYSDPMCIGISIVADAGYLPGDFRAGLTTRYPEPVAMDFFGDIEFRLWRTDSSEQVAEVAVQGFEPIGQANRSLALRVHVRDAVVNVHHVRTLDERMRESFVRWVQWMVDLEATAALA